MAKTFKIRDMQSGLFQDGGIHTQGRITEPVWTETGKSWKKLSEVKSHLFLLQKSRIVVSPFWEVVELDKVETAYPAISLVEKK